MILFLVLFQVASIAVLSASTADVEELAATSTSKLTSVVIDTFTSSVVVEVLAATSVVVDSITSSASLLAATSTSTSIAVDFLTSSVGSLSSSVSSTRM